MQHRWLVILGVCTACGSHAATPDAPVASPRTIGGFAAPESVLIAGSQRYVSNIGPTLDPLAKDGDGFVSELDAGGAIVQLRAFAPLDAPKGMAVIGNTLYVADIDRVVGFDRATHAVVFEAAPPPADRRLLNDLAVDAEGALLVTDTLQGALYRLQPGDRQFSTLAIGLAGANGVAVTRDGARAFVVALGADFAGGDLYAIDLRGGGSQRLGTAHGVFDGVAITATGELAISDWHTVDHPVPGTIALYRTDGTQARTVALPEDMHGPADFAYDPAREQLWIPRSLDGSMSIVDVR